MLSEFVNDYPQNSEQTVSFVARLSELEEDIKSNFQNYQTIVEKYFLNPLVGEVIVDTPADGVVIVPIPRFVVGT